MTSEHEPEVRVIREAWLSNKGGLAPASKGREYGRVLESLLIRELQRIASEKTDADLRFARGYVVDDYGEQVSDGLSEENPEKVTPQGPRFDIVCYSGNTAWTTNNHDTNDLTPFAVVPKSLANGVVEVKRTVTPKRMGPDSNEYFNSQLRTQRDYLSSLDCEIPHILIGLHFMGSAEEIRNEALADHVALLGGPNIKEPTEKMACQGELSTVVDVCLDETEVVEAVIERAQKMKEMWTNNGQCARERCAMRQYFGEDIRGYAASPHQQELACWIAVFRGEGSEKADRYVNQAKNKDQLFKNVRSAIRDAGYTDKDGELLVPVSESSIGPTLPYVLAHLEVVHGIDISDALDQYRAELIDSDSRWDGYRSDI